MDNKFYLPRIILFIFCIALFGKANAQFDESQLTVQSFQPVMMGNSIAKDSTRTLTFSSAGEDSVHIQNVISFSILEDQNIYFASGFTASVVFTLETKDQPGGTAVTSHKTLTVNYDTAKGSAYNKIAYILVPDAQVVTITIESVTITGASGWDPMAVLKLDDEMRAGSYFTLSSETNILTPIFITPVNNIDALHVEWIVNPNSHSNMSQLEWAWVSDDMAGYYKDNGVLNFPALFADNSTRVDIDPDKNQYDIPLLYDGAGKLYYRVREVYRRDNGSLICGPWAGNLSFSFMGHSNDLNWQRSTQFAENGKNKTVIQYFDGMMKARQTVTKDNTTGNTVVSETVYDFQGRPGIQILPTPTVDQTIQYFPGFNRFAGQSAGDNPAKYFDLTPEQFKCSAAPALDITKGNGRYYSPNNDWIPTEAKSKYIPDANGYAYTETRFTDDATQRIKSQGGVGENFRINSGHETKYYYGKPSQPEMDALFGTEVGYADHYFKNMVQDANGQMSVSYLDMHGRTVATALAGEAPENLKAIYGNPNVYPETESLTSNLLTPESNIIKGNSIESVNTLLVPSATNYDFTYKLNPGILKAFDCNQQQICFDCKYDLEIVIRPEDCGPEQTITKKFSNLQLVPAGESCDSAMGFTGDDISTPSKEIKFSATLAAGSWVVSKTLTINDSAFQARRETALAAFLCSSEESIYDSVLNILSDQTGCAVEDKVTAGCDSCLAHLGTFAQYRSAYLEGIGVSGSGTDYDVLIHKQYSSDSISCAVACGALDVAFSTLGNLRERMLNDMIPYSGQYALDTVLNANSASARFNVMITRSGHSETPYFRHPATETGQYHYFNDEGTVDQTIEPGSDNHLILDTLYKDGFARFFQYSWTQSLIMHHPEYSKLQFAESTLASSYNWLDSVQNCDSYSKAHTLGYDLPLTHDPFFVNNYVPANFTDMQRYISVNAGPASDTTHLSFWRLANAETLCSSVPDELKTSCAYGQSSTGISSSATPAQKDAIWEQFRSLYLSYRNEMVLGYINSRPNVITQGTMDSLITLDKKQLIFATSKDVAKQNGWSDWWDKLDNENHDTTGLGAAVSQFLDTLAADNCESQRIFWKQRLMQCEQLTSLLQHKLPGDTVQVNTIMNAILDSMVMVCHNSTDLQHPSGASDVNPSYQGTPQNFEDIVNHVFAQYGITTNTDSNYFCNPYSVDFPKPYNGMQPPLSTNYSNKIDTCGCNRFAALKAEAAQAGFDTLTLSGSNGMNQFLVSNYHDSLSTTLWNGLKLCNNGLFRDTCYSLMNGTGHPYEDPLSMMESESSFHPNVILPPDCPAISLNDVLPYATEVFALQDAGKSASQMLIPPPPNMIAYYSTGSGYTSCSIQVRDSVGGLVKTVSVSCGSNQSATFYLAECRQYTFRLYASNSACSKSSTSLPGNSPCPAPPCPDATVIDSVSYVNTSSVNNVYLHFTATAATDRRIIATDTATSQTYTQYIAAGDTTFILSLPACEGYTFQIFSGTVKNCYTFSNKYLLPACKDTCIRMYTPVTLDEFVPIPAFLNCNYQKPCISCNTIDNLVSEFRQKFPGMNAPYTDSVITDQQADQNSLLTRFLNYRTGFSATTSNYLTAYTNCHSTNPPSGPALCMFSKPLNDPTGFFEADTTPCRSAQTQAAFMAQQLYQLRKDSLIANFDSLYKARCLEAKYREEFYVRYKPAEYHYTLYFYDQAGNLVKTLPPAAVKPNFSQSFLDSVVAARNAGTDKINYENDEVLATNYRYNSLNQVMVQKTPDGGTGHFWFDRLGRLAISQNAKQLTANKYSYTMYDLLGRITEVGQALQATAMTQAISQDTTALKNWLAATTREEITGTVYDISYSPLETILNGNSALFQKHLRNRVSYTYIKESESTEPWDAATFYSYDITGNVDTLLQDFNSGMGSINCIGSGDPSGNRFKKMVYDYDLISGKVNGVSYQSNQKDAFYHRYEYDAENRITEIYSSKDKIFWEREASYDYYRHGPLARTVLGQNQVQGVDYAYTLQGWLKGVNSTAPSGFDIGKDGYTTGDLVARDAFGFALSYYQNSTQSDYQPIGASSIVKPFASADAAGSGFKSLYNGNISAMAVNLPARSEPLLFTYGYDQLNRIVNQNSYNGLDTATNSWNAHGLQAYRETVTYDPNGNISTYKRNGNASRSNSLNSGMDDLTYSYKPGTNQLDKVSDAAPDVSAGDYDRYNDIKKGQAAGNYQYDAIGNLISDASEGITAIDWNVYGKIKSIIKTGANIEYTYDAGGNRISKKVNNTYTYYVRDATGNIMSIYEREDTLKQKEIDLYGSSRLGSYNVDIDVQSCNKPPEETVIFTRGKKLFELTNHLGNVLATVSDKKIPHSTDGTTVAYYAADVTNAHHYYPFGMVMPEAGRDSVLFKSEFDTGTDGWGVYNAGTISNDNGRLKFSASQVWSTLKKDLQLETGKQYRVRFTIDLGNVHNLSIPIYKSDISSWVGLEGMAPLTSNGTYEGTFTATSNSMLLLFEMVPVGNPPPDSTGYYWLDDVSVEEIKPGDSSVAGNGGYRYAFNGKELDKETSSTTTYDYGFRIYNPALGKFLSVDPLFKDYPFYTPYQFAGNTPMQAIDLDGLEEYVIVKELYKNSKIKSITIQFTKDKAKNNVNVHFREVLGKNTDGTEKLGDYLTGNKVLRIVVDGNGHETLGDQSDNLTKEELSVVAKHTRNDLPENPTQDAWNISIGKNIYTSETVRNTSLMTDKIAEQRFPLIKNNELIQKFSGSTVFLGTTAILPGSGNYKNGQINWNDNESKRIKSLISRIKEEGDIKSISISIKLNISNATDADFKNFEAGVEYFGKQIKDAFSKSGIDPSKINIQTNVLRDKPNEELGTKVILSR